MSEMIERVARAILPELSKREMVLADPVTLERMMAKRIARAAIEAMRNVPKSITDDDRVRKASPWASAMVGVEIQQIYEAVIDTVLANGEP